MSLSSALVTGASGFIGKALVEDLRNKNIEVTCLVRKQSNIKRLSGVNYITIDSFTPDAIAQALKNITAEAVFHLAAYGVKPTERDPLLMLDINITALAALLIAVKDWPIKAFIYTGSCSEYAPAITNTPMKETQPLFSSSLYGSSKAAAEIYGASLATYLSLPFTVLRLFGVYGVGESDYRLIPHLINNLSKGKTAQLSPGEQVRDILYITDVIAALIAATNLPKATNTYNICSGIPITVKEIAQQVATLLNCSNELLSFGALPYRDNEEMWIVGDGKAFQQATSWKPKISLEQGIKLMIMDKHNENC